jgi:succinyl-CoA synthetase alpha subunit
VDASKAVLLDAADADANKLWVGNKAKAFVENGTVGVIGRSGQLTN